MSKDCDCLEDPTLRHLDVLLDVDQIVPYLARAFIDASMDFEVEHCRIERVKYKPGKSCMVVYCVDVPVQNGDVAVKRYIGRSYEPGGSGSRFEKARSRLSAPGEGQLISHIPSLDLVVWAFPHERKMTNLKALTAETAAPKSDLGRALEDIHGTGSFRLVERSLVHYAPEHTCCLSLTGHWQERARDRERPLTLYGKAYEDGRGADTADVMEQLYSQRAHGQTVPRIPRMVHYDSDQHILWQEGLPGRALAEVICDLDLLEHAAAALARLHKSMILCKRRIETPTRLGQLDRVLDLMRVIGSEHIPRMEITIDRLKMSAPNDAEGPIATLHGDFHAKNVLVHRGEAALIDLDNVAIGLPLYDVGSFVAALVHRTLVEARAIDAIAPTIVAFIEAYRRTAPWPISDDALAWHSAAALLEQRVYRTITRLKPGRLRLIGPLLEAAEDLLLNGIDTFGRRIAS